MANRHNSTRVQASGVLGVYAGIYGVYQPPGFFWQRILTSVIINKQGTFRPFATPHCVYPHPFLAIHHWFKPLIIPFQWPVRPAATRVQLWGAAPKASPRTAMPLTNQRSVCGFQMSLRGAFCSQVSGISYFFSVFLVYSACPSCLWFLLLGEVSCYEFLFYWQFPRDRWQCGELPNKS